MALNTNQGIWLLSDDLRLIKPSIEYKTSGWHKNELHTSNPIAKGVLSADGKWKERISDVKTSQLPRYEQYGQWFMNQDFTLLNSGQITFDNPIATHYYVKDNEGGLWIGTGSEGLFYLNKNHLKTFGLGKGELLSGNIYNLSFTDKNTILVNENLGLYEFYPDTGNWKKFPQMTLSHTFFQDSKNNIWVDRQGLCLLESGAYDQPCQSFPTIIPSHDSLKLAFESSDKTLWIASYNGLHVLNNSQWKNIHHRTIEYTKGVEIEGHGIFLATAREGVEVYQNTKLIKTLNENTGFPSNQIREIFQDPRIGSDALLIGTVDKGLCLYHLVDGFKRCASINEGLVHQGVHRIIPDKKDRLWMSSNKGIYFLKIEDLNLFMNHEINFLPNTLINEQQGMIDSEANGGVQTPGIVDDDGIMWFPTQQGLVKINTDAYPDSFKPLTAVIDSIRTSDQIIKKAKKITLYDPSSRYLDINLHTVALGNANDIQFRYRHNNASEWTLLYDSDHINFDHLAPGNHTIEFQAAQRGYWHGPTNALEVTVVPTIMETLWFKTLISMSIIMVLLLWIMRLRKRKTSLEQQVQVRTKDLHQALEVISKQKDDIKAEANRKQRHFLDLSHELRTPLTLVLTPLHSELSITKDTRQLMKRNADRLLNLVNQMLKIEQLDLFEDDQQHDEVAILERLKLTLKSFQFTAKEHQISISHQLPESDFFVLGSQSELDTLLINVIANAIKFTPDGGKIFARMDVIDRQCFIHIEDSGPGIPEQDRERVFQRFVKLGQENTQGSGLGLAIAKRICNRLNGSIFIESSDLGGAKFIITLPVTRQAELPAKSIPSKDNERVVLAIDDDADILMLIEGIMSPHYQVICSQIPSEALKIAKRRLPDLIIVDIGMPEMNGFELVQKLRAHPDTKNIPVIFATARSHPKDQVTAIETGGDAFLIKPFMPDQLKAYVNRLITTKTHAPLSENDSENSLLTRAKRIIDQHMSNPDFGIDELAHDLAMSRSAMYRSFKDEADLLPAEYIKKCRLEHASALIKNTKYNLSKIANLSGFSQQATFSRNFKKHFGHAPKDHK